MAMDFTEVSILHHVAIVFVVLWLLTSYGYCNMMAYFLAFAYLCLVYERHILRLRRRLQHEERKNSNQRKLLSDSESVRWLNHAVEKVWPICMEQIASQKFLLPIIPWFLDKYKPWTAKKAVVQHLYLGKSPPMFTEIRVLPQSADDDHLVLELGMNFLSGDDMSAILAVKLRKRLGFGLWAKMHVTGMHIEGKVLVGVKFLHQWPFLERLRISFVEPPYFQMTVKPIFTHGVDVTELPGIAGWLDKLLSIAFQQTLVEPNLLVVDVKKFVSDPKGMDPIPNPINVESEVVDDSAPLWKYVTKMEKAAKGGNYMFQCNFCNATFKGSYSRVKAHLMRLPGHGIKVCNKVTMANSSELQRVCDEAEMRLKRSAPKPVPLPGSGTFSSHGSHNMSTTSTMGPTFMQEGTKSTDPRKRRASTLEKAFNMEKKEQLHSEIARMFYSGGLPFHLARNPYYSSSYTFAANNAIPGYIPPGYNMLRTTLLQRERANLERLLEPTKVKWKDLGVSLVSDGWTDSQRRPLINFMSVSESGPMFLKAVNCEGDYKDKYYIANLMRQCIQEIGPQNVVQVITDNAPVCKAAGLLVEADYPHIFWTPCVVHTLNLALKNICAAKNSEANNVVYEECSWITDVAADASFIRYFIMNHSMRLAMFNEFVSLKMLTVAETRFASTIIMLKRLRTIKTCLGNMVVSEKWALFRDDDIVKAQAVKDKILDDIWWDKVDYILSFTEPMYAMLRATDTDKPCLHLVYDMWDSMIEKVKTIIYKHERKSLQEESSFYSVVYKILVDRWNKSNTPLHCMAHSLNPRYYSAGWLNADQTRVAPHKDVEISAERNRCLKRYFPLLEDRRLICVEFAKFSTMMEDFGDSDSITNREVLEPHLWWLVHGDSAPYLRQLASRLLQQPCSSSCSERNWSTYSFINSLRRNKITPKRGEDLVFVHTNLRLLSRRKKEYTEGETKMWDIACDAFDSFEGAGLLEVAELSLDEPELESIVFNDGDDNVNDDDVVE